MTVMKFLFSLILSGFCLKEILETRLLKNKSVNDVITMHGLGWGVTKGKFGFDAMLLKMKISLEFSCGQVSVDSEIIS